MASIQAPIPPENLPSNEVIMEDMALYAERIDLEGMMQEYLRRYDSRLMASRASITAESMYVKT